MLERRRHSRAREIFAGTIGYAVPGRGRATLDCVVRNASEGGALLVLDEPRRAPAQLEIATRGGVREARVVWRGETAVGVAFLPATDRAPVVVACPAAPAGASVVDLDAARRCRTAMTDESRLAERIARFVRPAAPRP